MRSHMSTSVFMLVLDSDNFIWRSCSLKTSILSVKCMPWWRHQMERFSALLVLCAGNSPGPVNSPHKGQWRRALMFSLICVYINGWVNNREAGDLRRHHGHYDVNLMPYREGQFQLLHCIPLRKCKCRFSYLHRLHILQRRLPDFTWTRQP